MLKSALSLLIILIFSISGLYLLLNNQKFEEKIRQEIPSFVISLRPERWQSFQIRWKAASKENHKKGFCNFLKLQKWPATDGRNIALNDPRWVHQPFLDPTIQSQRFTTRGEMGCFDSHLKIWQYIVEKNIPFALIFEDDADINLSRDRDKLEQWLVEFNQPNVKDYYDIVFLGYQWECPTLRSISSNLSEVDFSAYNSFYPTHAMLVTQRGAKKLLEQAYPYRLPVDLYIAEQIRYRNLRALKIMPLKSIIGVVPGYSDTQGIQ